MKVLLTAQKTVPLYKSQEKAKEIIANHKDWFPIMASPKMSGIVADLMFDGHLQSDLWRIDYTSKNKVELRRFSRELFDLFRVKSKIRKNTGNKFSTSFNLGMNNKLLSRILFRVGVPAGNKTNQKYSIPEWILENRENFREFAKQMFTCEGCAFVDDTNPFIDVSMWKREDLVQNAVDFLFLVKQKLIEYFGIETTDVYITKNKNTRKDSTISREVKFRIKRKDSLIKFYEEIGFDSKGKQVKLKKILRIKGQSGMGQ